MENWGGWFIKNWISSTVNEIHLNYKFAEQQAKRDFISQNKMKKLKKYLVFTSRWRVVRISASSLAEAELIAQELVAGWEQVNSVAPA